MKVLKEIYDVGAVHDTELGFYTRIHALSAANHRMFLQYGYTKEYIFWIIHACFYIIRRFQPSAFSFQYFRICGQESYALDILANTELEHLISIGI